MRWCCGALIGLACTLTGMELETSFSYYVHRVSSVQINDSNGTILTTSVFLTVYDTLLKLAKQKDGKKHLRELYNKCQNKYYVLAQDTVKQLQNPLQLSLGQFSHNDIELLCTFVLTKKKDSWNEQTPVRVRAPKDTIKKVELKKKDESPSD